MNLCAFVDPARLVGGNFGVDGERSAAKLAGLVKVALEAEFPGATIIVATGPEAVEVTPEDPDIAVRALNLLSALRKTADYLVFH